MQNNSTPLLNKKEVVEFQQTILNWYKKNKRDLPWRVPDGTLLKRDPYKILVSEVMAQQTQLSRVIPKYETWMQAFPTVESLAKASTRDVLAHWSGLGYNRRALYLKKCAETLVYSSSERSEPRSPNINSSRLRSNNKTLRFTVNSGISWPQTEKELRQLPGIGEYTARALLCFAFNHQVAVVDTNVRKVILTQIIYRHPEFTASRKLKPLGCISGSQEMLKQVQHDKNMIDEIAQELLPQGKAYDWNQALMDYAASELKEHKIPIPKQSKFLDSDRYFRGQTIKLLLSKNNQSFASLLKNIRKIKEIEKARYANVIAQLEKDKLITKKGSFFTLPE